MLDVFLEITKRLHPADLIRLTWTNKRFCARLTSRNFRPVWESSCRKYASGRPPRPLGMSPCGWAHVFREECHHCGNKTTNPILFPLRKRICDSCAPTKLVGWSYLKDKLPKMYGRAGDVLGVENVVPFVPHNHRQLYHGLVYEKDAADEFFELWMAALKSVKKEDGLNGWQNATRTLVREKKTMLEGRQAHLKVCSDWQARDTRRREQAIARERMETIKERLFDLGYTEADWHDSQLSTHWGVNVREPLDEKKWKDILPDLQCEIQRTKDKQLARKAERRDFVLRAYADTVRPADFPFLARVEDSIDSVPIVQNMIDQDVPEMDDEWRAAVKAAVPEVVQSALKTFQREKERLAIEVRKSISSEDVPSRSDLVAFGMALAVFQLQGADGSLSPTIYFGADVLPVWHAASTTPVISPGAQAILRSFIAALGLPETTTAEELDTIPSARVACTKCPPKKTLRPNGKVKFVPTTLALTWRVSVDHTLERHPAEAVSFRALTQDELADAWEREKVQWQGPSTRDDRAVWACCRCPPRDATGDLVWMLKSTAELHARQKHRVAVPAENVDFFWNPRVRKPERPCVNFTVQSGLDV
ncbi:hypothetical protein OF83DRAFT_1176185 [Amylostereum chailletii]|nr:hypothetical protein OF83DRAFT_1176185 [Amylostereum chailletii]